MSESASLWVRYLGGVHMHCAETFSIPTVEVPNKVSALRARGDVAEIWYLAHPVDGVFDRKLAHKEWPE